jgi:hypothetical protein
MDTPSNILNELHYIISFNLYTLSKTLFHATEDNLPVSHFRYIWTLFLLLNTFWHEWLRLVAPWNELLYIISFDLYTVSKAFFDAPFHNLTVSQDRYIWTLILL